MNRAVTVICELSALRYVSPGRAVEPTGSETGGAMCRRRPDAEIRYMEEGPTMVEALAVSGSNFWLSSNGLQPVRPTPTIVTITASPRSAARMRPEFSMNLSPRRGSNERVTSDIVYVMLYTAAALRKRGVRPPPERATELLRPPPRFENVHKFVFAPGSERRRTSASPLMVANQPGRLVRCDRFRIHEWILLRLVNPALFIYGSFDDELSTGEPHAAA